jgi:hypothetical protein
LADLQLVLLFLLSSLSSSMPQCALILLHECSVYTVSTNFRSTLAMGCDTPDSHRREACIACFVARGCTSMTLLDRSDG